MAAAGGHLELLQWARANGCPWDEDTFVRAAHGGHLEVVLEAVFDINKATDDINTPGMTPLLSAAQQGHEAVVQALIEAGVDVNKANHKVETPVYIAAKKGHKAVVRALIEASADINKAM